MFSCKELANPELTEYAFDGSTACIKEAQGMK